MKDSPILSARAVARDAVLKLAHERSVSLLTDSEWEKLVNLAWDGHERRQSSDGRQHRQNLLQVINAAVARQSGEAK